MSSSGDMTFESVWEDFQNKVKVYNTKQKKQILQLTSNAFQHILTSMPAPRKEGAEELASPSSANNKRLVADVESLVFDRFLQQGLDKSLFLRFDPKSTGLVSQQQFRASIATLGISLTPGEMDALVSKYDSDDSGMVNYSDFWKFLQAAAEQPRTTQQSSFSQASLNRPHQTGKDHASILRDIPQSLEERLNRGLQQMRETMYQKSSNVHGVFIQMQNVNKFVAVAELIPQLPKLGFPAGLVSDEELTQVALRYSLKNPGFFTYAEFLAFFTGHEPSPAVASPTDSGSVLDSPALMNCLVKVNNINLRKFFKDLDSDNDGLISTEELSRGLVESGGLHPAITKEASFKEYVESFGKRKPGFFGYADFIKFVNTRIHGNQGPISGQPVSGAHAPVRIPDDYTPSQMLELIIKTLRTSNISVESMFLQFDSNLDGSVDEAEFFQGVCSLGFILTAPQSKAFFDAVDSNKNGVVDVQEFASLIVNPGKNPKLSTRVRHAPGGASSVPMGSYASADPEPASRPSTARPGTQRGTLDLSASQTPYSEEEQSALAQRTSIKFTNQGASKIDLSFNDQPRPATASSPTNSDGEQAVYAAAASTSRAFRNPPGGRSTIDFVNDHGAQAVRPTAGPHVGQETDPNVLTFDPNAPVDKIRQKPVPLTAISSVELTDEQRPITTPARTMVKPLHSPGGESTVSFNQADSEILRTSKRVISTPGGTNNINLAFEDAALSPEAVDPVYRAQDVTSINLEFDPAAEVETQRRVRRAGATPNVTSVNLAHSSSRNEADLLEPHAMSNIKTKKHIDGSPVSVALGSEHGSKLLDSYKDIPVEIDPALIQSLSNAIYAHTQRLRQCFQEFNKNAQSATLSKANFVTGARGLNVALSDEQADALFARFDADGDGEITYSEFVRMLATK